MIYASTLNSRLLSRTMSGAARLSITGLMLLALVFVPASQGSTTCNDGLAFDSFSCDLNKKSAYQCWGNHCSKVGDRFSKDCEWKDAKFNADKPFSVKCDGEKVLTGSMIIYHDDKNEYKYQCCGFTGFPWFDCKPVQVWGQQGIVDYVVPEGSFVAAFSTDVAPGRFVNFTECSVF